MLTEIVVPDIAQDIDKYLAGESRVLPHRTNWASDLADPCIRKLVYHRTVWQQQAKPDAYLQGIFETGRRLEQIIINNLNQVGQQAQPQWGLAANGATLNDKFLTEHQIGCNPDVFLKVWPPDDARPHFIGPGDVKSCDPNVFRTVNTLEDMQRKPYMRRYIGQVTIYELSSNFERGWIILVNKSNLYDVKLIEIPLDYQYAESLVQKADCVNAHVAAGTLPPQINNPEDCNRCPYKAYCCPPCATGGNLKQVDIPELSEVLDRLHELQAYVTEIETLEKTKGKILDTLKGQDVVCGPYLIQWSKSEGMSKPQEAKPWVRWNKKIIRMDGAGEQES